MHHNHFEAIQCVQKLTFRLDKEDTERADVSVHPPFTDLRSIQTMIEADDLAIRLGAQHCHWEDKGAFTGEVSPGMLAKLQVSYVIAGHSERRQLFGEDDEVVNRKVLAILAAGMTPILCCGETLDEREAGSTDDRVRAQVRAGLAGVSPEQVAAMVVAYEPIWAIGTGRTATPEDAQATCATVRQVVGEVAGDDAASAVLVQYGGSVKSSNAAQLLSQPDIDGALVGGASLDPDEFALIVQSIPAP
jgi:triosephosphate isomerase